MVDNVINKDILQNNSNEETQKLIKNISELINLYRSSLCSVCVFLESLETILNGKLENNLIIKIQETKNTIKAIVDCK